MNLTESVKRRTPHEAPVKRLEPVPENCGRFSDQDRLTSKGIEHFQ